MGDYWQYLLDSLPLPGALVQEGVVRFLNRQAQDLTGYISGSSWNLPTSGEVALGTSYFSLLPQENEAGTLIILQPNDQLQSAEERCRHQTIGYREQSELARYHTKLESMLEERTWELNRLNSLLRQEVNQRKRLEKDITQFFNMSRDIFIIADYDGQLLTANASLQQVMGFSLPDFKLQRLRSLCHPEDAQHFTDTLRWGLATGEPIEGQVTRFKDVHDVWRWLDWVAVPMVSERLIYVVARDFTARKELETEMAHLERLSLIGQIAAGIGHEIRNPLTTVRGALQLLEWTAHENTAQYLQITLRELDRAVKIITEFLSLSKSQSRRIVQDLNQILSELMLLVGADARTGGKAVEFIPGDIPMLELDEGEIRQLVLNLAHNGLEAMEEGGLLKVTTFRQGEDVFIEVHNNGAQIPPEIMKKVGTPFFTTKEKGTGLGLAVCHSIARRHNARLTWFSEESGTTFILRFINAAKAGDTLTAPA